MKVFELVQNVLMSLIQCLLFQVSAAKYARAERDLKAARPLGNAAQAFYNQAEVRTYRQITVYHKLKLFLVQFEGMIND